MTSKVLCRYHMNRMCNKGEQCAFSHDFAAMPSQTCRYYLAGCCAYGDQCRFDHVRPDWSAAAANRAARDASSAAALPPVTVPRPDAGADAGQPLVPATRSGQAAWQATSGQRGWSSSSWGAAGDTWCDEQATWRKARDTTQAAPEAWRAAEEEIFWEHEQVAEPVSEPSAHSFSSEDQAQGESSPAEAGSILEPGSRSPRDGGKNEGEGTAGVPAECSGKGGSTDLQADLCGAYTLSGRCGKRACNLVHGAVCQSCGKWALHPYNAGAAARHADECAARHERLAAAARSADVECAICLERVLGTRGRKFGLLENCEHAFCLACIRSWRATAEVGPAGDTAVRCCPLCRQLSWFVTPSAIWPDTKEAKAATIAAYKGKLATVDCRMFAAGAGTCPHGTSCFYRHAYPDGRLEEKTLRRNVDAEGDMHVVRGVCLSDFIQASAAAHRALRRRAA